MIEQRQHWLSPAIRATFAVYREQGASAWIKAQGHSMRPLIAPGARLLVEFGAPAHVGEIVVFEQGDRIIAHRLVARLAAGGRLIAKGDAEAYCDRPLDPNDILGVVRALAASPAAAATSATCGGRPAAAIARVSWWGGRGAALARRVAAFLPDPLRRIALRAIPPLARVAALALLAPIIWAAQIQIAIDHNRERR